jgi:propionate CoA-transferase
MSKKVTNPVGADLKAKMKRGKVVSVEEAVAVIMDGDTVAFEGIAGSVFPEEVAMKIEESFLKTGKPKGLTIFYCSGQGDGVKRGQQHLAHEGLMAKVIAGHFGMAPNIGKLVAANKIIAYNLPQGVLSEMTRDIAAHKPRTVTHVGLGTFVDPRNGGGKLTSLTKEDMVELVKFDGKEYLAYKTFPINVSIIRGTTADLDGNISMEKESLFLTNLPLAMAAKNSGGFVIAQVERVVARGALKPKDVKVPGIMVDCVVVAKPENHWQTFVGQYNPSFAGEFKVPMQSIPPLPLDERKIIGRRAAFEIGLNDIVNLGFGMPMGMASICAEEGLMEYITMSTEAGTIGGVPAPEGLNFGSSTNPDAIIDMASMFDFYDGGGLDVTFLGLAQVDKEGNLNVSKFGPKLAGAGGFINISQTAKKLVFVGTFTAGDVKYKFGDGKIVVEKDTTIKKFIDQVEQKTFSGPVAINFKQPVVFVTERCVFRLTPKGLELTEIAPGIDLQRDILDKMDFKPIIKQPIPLMDERIFKEEPMGLKDDLLNIPITERVTYDPVENVLFNNFEGWAVRTREDIAEVKARIDSICGPLGKKVKCIVNYDNFSIAPELEDEYLKIVKYVVDKYYESVSRYTTSAFMRMKLGDALTQKAKLEPSLFKTEKQAKDALKKGK